MDHSERYASKYEWDCKGRHIEVYHTNRTIPVRICIDGTEYGYAYFDKGFVPKLRHEIAWEDLKLTLIFENGRFTLLDDGQPVKQENSKGSATEWFQLQLKFFFGLLAVAPLLYPLIKSVPWYFKLIAGIIGVASITSLILIFKSTKLSWTKKMLLCIPVSLSGIIVMLITVIANYAK